MPTEEQISKMRIAEIRFDNKPKLPFGPYDNARTCVIVVDMCEGFCYTGALASPNVAAIIPSIAGALDFLPRADKFFVNDRHNPDSAEFRYFPVHCVRDRECAVVKPLARFAKNTILKNSTNGFFALEKRICLDAYDNYFVMGCCTDLCVLQLALSLRAALNERNLPANVLVTAKTAATYDAPDHDAELFSVFAFSILETAGVQVFKNLN